MNDKSMIGIQPDLEIKGGLKEKKIVEKLSKSFRITFSKTVSFKYSEYNFSFLKPEGRFKEMYNLYNEVLLLFLPYSVFDSRSLDFVDKTLSIDYPNRLDKICVVIVSADEDIEKKIETQNSKNKESKILVPFTYDEILANDFSSVKLESKFNKYFYSRDLFALESPLKSENYFFGRNQVVQELYDKYCLGEHSGLFGLRKIGKTSVLYGLERMILLRQGCSIYIDCQDTAIHKSCWNELLFKIINNLKEKYNLGVETLDISKYSEAQASQSFESDLKTIKNTFTNSPRILLIFDEIEHISFDTSSSIDWKEGNNYIYFWQTIRAIYQKNDNLFSFLIAGVNPHCIEKPKIQSYDNPIFSLITPTYLELFNIRNVNEMVESIGKYMGLIFEPELFTHLTDDYGGHPFLIRHVCSLINKDITNNRPYTVTKYMYKEKKESYDNLIQPYVELIIDILRDWYPEEYRLLEILVDEGSDNFSKEIKFNGNVIQHLIGYGIVREQNSRYYVTINAVEKYLNFIIKKTKKPNTKAEKWSHITVRRNTLEENLRVVVVNGLRYHFGKKAKEKLLLVIDESRRKKISNLTFEDIYKNHLYFSDLIKIVTKHWSFYENIFYEKMKFETYMDYVNKNRIDAHAKDISDEDLTLLMISLKWLEEAVNEMH